MGDNYIFKGNVILGVYKKNNDFDVYFLNFYF